MPKLVIDNQSVEVSPGETVLSAAAKLGIKIPTLCHHSSLPSVNSCMVCLVKNLRDSQLIPACSYPAGEGLELDASSAEVRQARKDALELLLREHLGDCEAPCRRGCPADLDIPAMLKAVSAGEWEKAGQLVRTHIPLPMILGRICPAPCEKICRRKDYDFPLHIREIKYQVGEATARDRVPGVVSNGKLIGIVGAGPAGASAAWFLRAMGYQCRLYDRATAPWDVLAEKVGVDILPPEVAGGDYQTLMDNDVTLICERKICNPGDIDALLADHDAILLAGGESMRDLLGQSSMQIQDHYQTSIERVFVCGSLRKSCRKLAVRAVGDARKATLAMHDFLQGNRLTRASVFDSRAGNLSERQLESLVLNSDCPEKLRQSPVCPETRDEARQEASRCLACACKASSDCELRRQAEVYEIQGIHAHPPRVPGDAPLMENEHPEVTYEEGKCIRCGLCVRLTEARGEPWGLTFLGRGRKTRLSPPLGKSWREALTVCARECADLCPTGAITYKESFSGCKSAL